MLALMAAMGENRVIGRGEDLPWSLPDDFAYFKRLTQHHVVMVGRRTFDGLGPLPNRVNLVVSGRGKNCPGADAVLPSAEAALDYGQNLLQQRSDLGSTLFCIGGQHLYESMLPWADRLYLTEVHASPEGDSFFPLFDHAQWQEVSRAYHAADARHQHAFSFVVWDRKRDQQ